MTAASSAAVGGSKASPSTSVEFSRAIFSMWIASLGASASKALMSAMARLKRGGEGGERCRRCWSFAKAAKGGGRGVQNAVKGSVAASQDAASCLQQQCHAAAPFCGVGGLGNSRQLDASGIASVAAPLPRAIGDDHRHRAIRRFWIEFESRKILILPVVRAKELAVI